LKCKHTHFARGGLENGDGAEYINDVLYGVGINPTVYNITKENEQ